jgi:pilus assembly protein CpaC
MRWLETNSLLRTLAEPTLTAISGESAKFLAGGEYPIPVGQSQTNGVNTLSVEFKTFGVSLVFTPVVLTEGRISLKIGTEVSELSVENSVKVSGLTIPGLKVRRADSTLELPSGGTIVMAGLLQESTKQSIDRLPGLGNLPVIGSIFRSREFQRQQTELVVMVTPYIVKPVSRNSLSKPDDGFQEVSDAKGFLMGQFNKVYGSEQAGKVNSSRNYAGPVGHIKD